MTAGVGDTARGISIGHSHNHSHNDSLDHTHRLPTATNRDSNQPREAVVDFPGQSPSRT